jgi:glycosyltransferase involved in cell wall biosynthesis
MDPRRVHPVPASAPQVSVIIPCHNHGRFLGDAIQSVFAQTYRCFEIVIVNDGSTDHTASVAKQYPEVRYLEQEQQGLAAARNAGLRASRGDYLVFLDADDRLLPRALEAGLECFARCPECAFVSGRHVRIALEGHPKPSLQPILPTQQHYLALLRRNYIGMHAAVMYRRAALLAAGGFDPTLTACEDYDLYLRIARQHPVAAHEETVAEYRIHPNNMSADKGLMLTMALSVLRRQRPYLTRDPHRLKAYRDGLRFWRDLYGNALLWQLLNPPRQRTAGTTFQQLHLLCRHAPLTALAAPGRLLKHLLRKAARTLIPAGIRRFTTSRSIPLPNPPVGRVRFGDLRRLAPISRRIGFDRGLPIDRYYIETFLNQNARAIQGRVLEVGDDEYTRRMGRDRVTRGDVLHVSPGNPEATFVRDLSRADALPSDTFDCVILTRTLHLIYDLRAALATLHRILKPEGVLLMTVPGTINQLERARWSTVWHWGFTGLSIRNLVVDVFDPDQVTVQVHGNVLASIGFLHGVAADELRPDELAFNDPQYPLLITVHARKHRDPIPHPTTGPELTSGAIQGRFLP